MATRSPVSRPRPLQPVGEPTDLGMEVGIGENPGVAGLTDPVVGHLVAMALEMTVETVVGEIELTIGEPLEERWVGVVEDQGGLGLPGDPGQRLLLPEGEIVGSRLFVDPGLGVGLGGELGRWWELAVFGKQVLQGLAHALSSSSGRREATRGFRARHQVMRPTAAAAIIRTSPVRA